MARAFARNRPLRDEVRAGLISRIEVVSPGGIYLGTAPGIRFDRERVYPSLEKMVRGLYRHHTGRLLSPDTKFVWAINEVMHGNRQAHFEAAIPGLNYVDVFECRYVVVAERGLEATLWWLRFYRATVFRCYTAPQPLYAPVPDSTR